MEDTLDEILNRIIEKYFSQEQMMLLLVKEKLREYGIELTKYQENKLILQMLEHGLNEFTFKPIVIKRHFLRNWVVIIWC